MTKAQIKLIQSLSRQKYRKEYNAYLVEGDKNAKEWLQSNSRIKHIVVVESWMKQNIALIHHHPEAEVIIAADFELEKITSLQTAQEVVLVVERAPNFPFEQNKNEWSLLLDKIQDPGNMGSIIRTADWFGIQQIVCTPDCVEVYNPKVVQASMGSLLRVKIKEMTIEDFLEANTLPLYAACLYGSNIKELSNNPKGVIAMGNESKGLSDTVLDAANYKITIPKYGHAESLNVAVATGIVCALLDVRR